MRRRSKQVAEVHPLDGVRSMWEFVFISQFLRFFQDKFGFVHFEVEELENAFLEAENHPLFSIFARLLRLLLGRSDIRMSNWEETLKVELEERGAEPNPLDEGNYAEIAADDRVLLLKYIIDYICDGENENFNEIKEFKKDFLNHDSEKTKPIGQDTQGYIYWYFDDLRLYREKTTKKGSKRSWATVCTTSDDWENIIKSLQKNKENEKKLHDYLQDELYPSVEPLLKEHEKEKEQLNNKKKKLKSIKSKKDLSKEDERDALIKQEEEEIGRMKQEEESVKQAMENEHRKKGRRRKEAEVERSSSDTNDEKEMESRREQEEIQKRIAEEIEKQESLVTAEDIESGLVPRTRRKCVIMREQTTKKKEWWEEEGIGSDLEDEEDIDSDSSDGPRRRKKKPKLMRPVEPPGPMNRTYVFSTALANRAAEAVQQGRVDSIIAYHRAQQTTSPYVRLEKERTFDKSYDQQKAYFSQGYPQQPAVGTMMSRGYGRIPGMHPDANPGSGGRPGYNPAQWQQFQMQPPYMKERQQRQAGVDDLSQILFGGAVNGNGQNAPAAGSYPQRMPGQQYGYPQRMGSQQQPYQDNRMAQEGYRPPFQQGYNQQQQYFQRPRNLPQLHSPGAQSPSSDPLGANVRSPPPPYPGARSGESRAQQHHMGNSPVAVPSPTSTGSPQTPLTPHTPRFPGAAPSPGEPSKPPFSPTNPQQSNYSAGTFPGQPQRPGSESSGSDTGGDGRQGYVDLGSKGYAQTTQQQGYAGMADNNHDNLQSPTEPRSMGGSNKSPFLVASQAMSSASASMPKSFSVESLTAPSVPSDQAGHPLTADQQMGPYSGIYYQTKYQPPAMYGGQRYQYPSTIQHSGAFYNSQLSSNMYLDRGSMQVYPPGRESGL